MLPNSVQTQFLMHSSSSVEHRLHYDMFYKIPLTYVETCTHDGIIIPFRVVPDKLLWPWLCCRRLCGITAASCTARSSWLQYSMVQWQCGRLHAPIFSATLLYCWGVSVVPTMVSKNGSWVRRNSILSKFFFSRNLIFSSEFFHSQYKLSSHVLLQGEIQTETDTDFTVYGDFI